MYDVPLTRLRRCVAREGCTAAFQVVRDAINTGQIEPRDGVELMLVLQEGTPEMIVEAIEAMRAGLPGSYRYVPKADYAVA